MKVTVIIPFNIDRGWLKQAIESVPKKVQLLLSQGEGNWPQNFNKALKEATGDYIRYLHEDDMLLPGSIDYAVKALEEQKVDFVHGNALELYPNGDKLLWKPAAKRPLLNDLLRKNTIHSVTTMYRRDVFERVGGFNESPDMYSFEEFEFHLRCLKAGLKIGYVPMILGVYRRHPRQIIRTVDKTLRAENRQKLVNSYMYV